MTRLAVLAHYDSRGEVGPHVRRQVEALTAAFDDVVAVTTAELTGPARAWLSARVRLIERDNVGYDFFSYRVGLEAGGDLERYDEVVVCNDSYVGPLIPYEGIIASMADRPCDFWGLTYSEQIKPHVQSFFVAFRPSAVASEAFRRFWGDMEPLDDRAKVIRRFEIGMTRRLVKGGLRPAGYFEATPADRRVARARRFWAALHRGRFPRTPSEWGTVRRVGARPWNPAAALADRALDGGRMPFVKLDTLRYDPFGLDADHLLDLCEKRFPEAFDGVRDYLEQTARDYPIRPGDRLRPTHRALRPLYPLVRYGDPSGRR